MSEFSKYFDTYSFNARVKPVLFLVFPVVITIFILVEEARTWGGAVATFLLTFGIVNFATNQMSTKGNILQEKLFLKWGGAPTTIILRHSDSRLDRYTKARYMSKLSSVLKDFSPISEEYERENPSLADEMYRTGSNYLLEYTRDKKIFPLIFIENVAYGFSKNLRAVKPHGISITVMALLISLLIILKDFHPLDLYSLRQYLPTIPYQYYGLIVIHLVTLGSWTLLITEKWVQIRGFAYAKRLYSACENIDK